MVGSARISQLIGFGEGGIGIRVGTATQDLKKLKKSKSSPYQVLGVSLS
jgi:hypothetical protein